MVNLPKPGVSDSRIIWKHNLLKPRKQSKPEGTILTLIHFLHNCNRFSYTKLQHLSTLLWASSKSKKTHFRSFWPSLYFSRSIPKANIASVVLFLETKYSLLTSAYLPLPFPITSLCESSSLFFYSFYNSALLPSSQKWVELISLKHTQNKWRDCNVVWSF